MQAVKQQNLPNGRYLVRREIYGKDKNVTYWRLLVGLRRNAGVTYLQP